MKDENAVWRYVPEQLTVVHRCSMFGGTAGYMSGITVIVHPVRPEGCVVIRKDWQGKVLERRAPCGCVRYLGIKDGKINSELRMVIIPSNTKDEVVNDWEPCYEV